MIHNYFGIGTLLRALPDEFEVASLLWDVMGTPTKIKAVGIGNNQVCLSWIYDCTDSVENYGRTLMYSLRIDHEGTPYDVSVPLAKRFGISIPMGPKHMVAAYKAMCDHYDVIRKRDILDQHNQHNQLVIEDVLDWLGVL